MFCQTKEVALIRGHWSCGQSDSDRSRKRREMIHVFVAFTGMSICFMSWIVKHFC